MPSAPSTLERCRMALAEIGYDPAVVRRVNADGTIVARIGALPEVVRWMLRSTVAAGQQMN